MIYFIADECSSFECANNLLIFFMETLEIKLEDHKYQFEYETEQIDIPQPLYVFYIKPKKKSKLEFLYTRFFMIGIILPDNSIQIFYNEYNEEKTVLKEEIKKQLEVLYKENSITLVERKKRKRDRQKKE
jgi:hypothetical protein